MSGYRRSVALDAGMYQAAAQLAKTLRYSGLAMIEFKQNPRTRDWKLLEINARVWGSLPLSIAAGLDFPRYLYEMLILNRTNFPRRYRVNFYCRHWTSDLEWLRANAAADRKDSTLLIRSHASIAAEVFHILSLREQRYFPGRRPDSRVLRISSILRCQIFRYPQTIPILSEIQGKTGRGGICRRTARALCLPRKHLQESVCCAPSGNAGPAIADILSGVPSGSRPPPAGRGD